MTDHFSLLMDFYYRLGVLDGAQEVIDELRVENPDDIEMQVHFDWRQGVMNQEREEIERLMLSIPMSN